MRKTLEAAMSLRCGVDADTLEKSYGAQTVEAGVSDILRIINFNMYFQNTVQV